MCACACLCMYIVNHMHYTEHIIAMDVLDKRNIEKQSFYLHHYYGYLASVYLRHATEMTSKTAAAVLPTGL